MPVDGVVLNMHGAMQSEDCFDCEGNIFVRIARLSDQMSNRELLTSCMHYNRVWCRVLMHCLSHISLPSRGCRFAQRSLSTSHGKDPNREIIVFA